MMGVRKAEAGILRMRKGGGAVEEKAGCDPKPMQMQFGTPGDDLKGYSSPKNPNYRRDI